MAKLYQDCLHFLCRIISTSRKSLRFDSALLSLNSGTGCGPCNSDFRVQGCQYLRDVSRQKTPLAASFRIPIALCGLYLCALFDSRSLPSVYMKNSSKNPHTKLYRNLDIEPLQQPFKRNLPLAKSYFFVGWSIAPIKQSSAIA